MAARYVEARNALVRAGRTLHDHIGSSLSAVGLQLQLLRMDVPAVQTQVDEAIRTLDEALDRVRELSRALCPSPAHRGGLKQALLQLAGKYASDCEVEVQYAATGALPDDIGVALYEAAQALVERAMEHGATHVHISVRGKRPLILRIRDNGRSTGRRRSISLVRTLACEQGLTFEYATGKSTIVSIGYAVRRTARG